jgi:hypothetical protein
MFARAVSRPACFKELPAVVSKYLKAMVGAIRVGTDTRHALAVNSPWPSVCGCVAKTLELAQIPRISPLRPI